MNRDQWLRRFLWASAAFNMGGVGLFAFSGSALSQMFDLPAEVPPLYRALTVLFMLLFGGAYAWAAAAPRIERPLVVFGAIGKLAAFAVVAGLWATSAITTRTLGMVSGDLVFAALFFWALAGARTDARAAPALS
ncbi:hypothetical protein FHW69_003519 [Luteibacter sp. Sphag1AF]|uniref:hypothetical protein n=1 Tax=Luteibacter sp. Sphag1AF TaxID=2587031 RepID=UPI001614956E|nr:hypothetical protein [Luteibacter sp. Sphag1AF]MBB3228874.1 hypothetical protein [Luteibacter sp. Sphag1AF]